MIGLLTTLGRAFHASSVSRCCGKLRLYPFCYVPRIICILLHTLCVVVYPRYYHYQQVVFYCFLFQRKMLFQSVYFRGTFKFLLIRTVVVCWLFSNLCCISLYTLYYWLPSAGYHVVLYYYRYYRAGTFLLMLHECNFFKGTFFYV